MVYIIIIHVLNQASILIVATIYIITCKGLKRFTAMTRKHKVIVICAEPLRLSRLGILDKIIHSDHLVSAVFRRSLSDSFLELAHKAVFTFISASS